MNTFRRNLVLAVAPLAVAAPALAQGPAQQAGQDATAASAAMPVPGEMELAKLVWSTMAMIDHANKSGNYSVLRDSSAAGFQLANDPARLAQIFAGLRATGIDLSNCLLVAPAYDAPPRLVKADLLRVTGHFPLRPRAVAFDLLFRWQQGTWALFGVSVQPRAMPGSPQAAP